MQAILDTGWPFLSVSGFVTHALVLILALAFIVWALWGKGKRSTLELLDQYVSSPTYLRLGMLIAAFVISYSSLKHLPYPHTPLWVLLLLTWIVFPLAIAYGWFAWLGLLKEEEIQENRAFKDAEFPGLFVALVTVISFFVFKPQLGESEFMGEKKKIVEAVYGLNAGSEEMTFASLEDSGTYKAALRPIIVSRWGMMFYHPQDWAIREPDNGDGYRFSFPEDDQVFVIGSGSYATQTNCDTFCTAEIEWERSIITNRPDYEILSEGYVEKWVIADSSLVNGPYNVVLQGYEFQYSYTNEEGVKHFVHSSFSLHEGINFGTHAECPFEERDKFGELFRQVNARYYLLREKQEGRSVNDF